MSTRAINQGITLPNLEEVEKVINDALSAPCCSLQEIVDYLLSRGGKKLRPLLVLLSARLADRQKAEEKNEALLKVAAAVELIHTASLIHDDIIDGASHRRGIETLHRRWGEQEATLVGDYLLARAFQLIGELEQNELLLPLIARSVYLLCRGEALQLDKSFQWGMGEQDYFRCNYLKTSQLLAVCCEAGGRLVEAGPREIRALREYGFNLGQAFQIADDILDYAEKPERAGKSTGIDLNQGVITLPLIYFLQRNKRYQAFLQSVFSTRSTCPPELQRRIYRAVRGSGALEYSYEKVRKSVDEALTSIKSFSPEPASHLLIQIANGVADKISTVLHQL